MDWSDTVGKRVQAAIEIRWGTDDMKFWVRRGTFGTITQVTAHKVKIE